MSLCLYVMGIFADFTFKVRHWALCEEIGCFLTLGPQWHYSFLSCEQTQISYVQGLI